LIPPGAASAFLGIDVSPARFIAAAFFRGPGSSLEKHGKKRHFSKKNGKKTERLLHIQDFFAKI